MNRRDKGKDKDKAKDEDKQRYDSCACVPRRTPSITHAYFTSRLLHDTTWPRRIMEKTSLSRRVI